MCWENENRNRSSCRFWLKIISISCHWEAALCPPYSPGWTWCMTRSLDDPICRMTHQQGSKLDASRGFMTRSPNSRLRAVSHHPVSTPWSPPSSGLTLHLLLQLLQPPPHSSFCPLTTHSNMVSTISVRTLLPKHEFHIVTPPRTSLEASNCSKMQTLRQQLSKCGP